MEDLRAKIFPLKRRKVTAPELLPSTTLPMRRKERSLSSLVIDTPKLSSQNTVAGTRTKLASRKAQGCDTIERHVKEEQDSAPESSSSQDTLRKFTRSIKQVKKKVFLLPFLTTTKPTPNNWFSMVIDVFAWEC